MYDCLPSTYNATRCGWATELLRPRFIDFDHVPPQCAAAPAQGGGGGAGGGLGGSATELLLTGAGLGALGCGLLALLLSLLAPRLSGRRLFVVLREEEVLRARSGSAPLT